MPPLEPIAMHDEFPLPSGLEEVGCFADASAAADRGLVVLAMRLAYWVVPTQDGHRLLVESGAAPHVREQLALYDRESQNWPPKPRPIPRLRFRWALPGVWVLVVAGVFRAQQMHPGDLEAAGSLDAAAIFERGEWWRPASSLFLHADLGHLVANLASGFFLFGLILGQAGAARGGLLIAAAAIAGNILAALLHPWHGYTAIGASTAVFSALGLLTGAALRMALAEGVPGRMRTLLLPALAGSSLLALYGSGGLQTDVVAHGTGFLAGILLGICVRHIRTSGA